MLNLHGKINWRGLGGGGGEGVSVVSSANNWFFCGFSFQILSCCWEFYQNVHVHFIYFSIVWVCLA